MIIKKLTITITKMILITRISLAHTTSRIFGGHRYQCLTAPNFRGPPSPPGSTYPWALWLSSWVPTVRLTKCSLSLQLCIADEWNYVDRYLLI